MFNSYYKIKMHAAVIAALVVLPSVSAFASPPDSTEIIGPSHAVSLKKIKSTLGLQRSTSLTKVEEKEVADPNGLFSKFLSGINVGGYYRAYAIGRAMPNDYAGLGLQKVYNIGDGNFDPVMMMYIGGNPTATTSFGTEVMIANPFEAYRGPGTGERTFNNFFNMVLRGNTNTKFGNFGVVVGGIEWTQLSPFTFGSNVGYQRYSLWERRPWDPVGNVNTRYASYYYNGTINQDQRFGTRAFKGVIINGYNMPYNTSINFFYGRTDQNGGFDRESFVRPKSNIGGKINKDFKNNNRISLNTFNSFVTPDSINGKRDVQWNIFTTEYNFNWKGFNLNGEIGVGGYESKLYKRSWGEGVLVNLNTPKKYTFLPFSLRYFQISKSFTSNVSQFSNTSIQEVTNGYLAQNAVVLVPFGGNMSAVGDLANNRRGGAINTEVKVWKFKFLAGLQMESEMSRLNNQNIVTYGHRINSLTWSRLPMAFPYPFAMGPNGRVKTFYRGAYETVNVSESYADSTALYRKHYSSLDFQIKFKTKLFNRDIYMYNLNTFMSVQNKFSPVPVLSDKAYIRAQYHEAEVYYHVMRDLIFSVYGGLEYIKGNKYTDTTTTANSVDGTSGKARNQVGKAFGLGLDISLSNQTSLFIRHRRFSFADKYFQGEDFAGQETTLELKIFF